MKRPLSHTLLIVTAAFTLLACRRQAKRLDDAEMARALNAGDARSLSQLLQAGVRFPPAEGRYDLVEWLAVKKNFPLLQAIQASGYDLNSITNGRGNLIMSALEVEFDTNLVAWAITHGVSVARAAPLDSSPVFYLAGHNKFALASMALKSGFEREKLFSRREYEYLVRVLTFKKGQYPGHEVEDLLELVKARGIYDEKEDKPQRVPRVAPY